MIFETAEDFTRQIGPDGAILGLDLGTKTIGVAVSDSFRMTANAVTTIKRKKFTLDAIELAKIIADRATVGVVLGLPRNMDGTEGPRAQSTRAFARNLERMPEFTAMPITFWDERLSTIAAEKALLAADMTRKRRAEVIDAVAATYILQGVLDRLRHLGVAP
jgi:putative Holliday junction resolvase